MSYLPKTRVLISAHTFGTVLLFATTGNRAGMYYVDCGKIPGRDVPTWKWMYPSELDRFNPVHTCAEPPALSVYPQAAFLGIANGILERVTGNVDVRRAYAESELMDTAA